MEWWVGKSSSKCDNAGVHQTIHHRKMHLRSTYVPTYLPRLQSNILYVETVLTFGKKIGRHLRRLPWRWFPVEIKEIFGDFLVFHCKMFSFLNSQASVTIFGEISPLWQKLKCLWQFYEGFFSIWLKFGKFGKFWIQLGNFWRHYMDYNENYNEKPFGHNVHNINYLSDNRGT